MEIDITRFFRETCPSDYSASRAEIGSNAGADTWRAACDDTDDYAILDSEDAREQFRAYIAGFGAWDDEEISAMSDTDLNALFIQLIAGDIRETLRLGFGLRPDTDQWQALQSVFHSENSPGRITLADNGQVYYYVGT